MQELLVNYNNIIIHFNKRFGPNENMSKEEFYANLEGELQGFENKLNKWNPTNSDGKRLKGQLEQTLASLKLTNAMKTGCGLYSLDTMKFEFLKNNIK